MSPGAWRRAAPALIVGAGPVLLAGAILLAVALVPRAAPPARLVWLLPVQVRSPDQLEATFKSYQYTWTPSGKVPPLGLVRLPRGLDALEPEHRKSLFLRAMLPLVLAANKRIRRQRNYLERVLKVPNRQSWPRRARRIAEDYDVHESLDHPAARADLLRRCNVIPPGLVLAQAAKESGWGTSRFALEGNNLFGVHTWNQSLALKAGAAARHSVKVRSYPDLRASVRDYIYNLNVGHAYVAFRKLRERQAARGSMDALALARTLGGYSTLGEMYTQRLQALIKNNALVDLQSPHLGEIGLVP